MPCRIKKNEMYLQEMRIKEKKKKYACKWLSNAVLINYFAVYTIVLVSGLSWSPDNVQYSLDSWVVVVLIGGVTGSATVYFWRRIVDFAYGS